MSIVAQIIYDLIPLIKAACGLVAAVTLPIWVLYRVIRSAVRDANKDLYVVIRAAVGDALKIMPPGTDGISHDRHASPALSPRAFPEVVDDTEIGQ